MLKSRLLGEPLLHFLVLGAALFGLYALSGARRGESAGSQEIVVSAGRVHSLTETFSRQWGRPPSDDELGGLVRDFIREEVLAREAMALGLDRDDTIVRRRLAQKMEFLSDDVGVGTQPTDDDLRAYLAAHPERFRVEARFTFDQVFLDRDKRGGRLDADAAALQATLNTNGGGPDLGLLGDSRLLDSHFEDVGRGEVEARFGARFAERLETLPLDHFEWPVESGYGFHLVRIDRRTPAYVPPFEAVRDAVAREWANANRTESKEAVLQTLLARYRVTIETRAANDPDPIAEVR
jgi:hypothetical protein